MGVYEVIAFEGANVGDGDQAHWVRVDAQTPVHRLEVDCNAPAPSALDGDATRANVRTNTRQVLGGKVTFTFASWGSYVLCYKWRHGTGHAQEGFVPFTSIRVAVLQFSGPNPNPNTSI